MSNIVYQMNSAIIDCFVPGRSKRSDKFDEGYDWRIYSYAHKDSLHEIGKNFARFCSVNYNVKKLCDINVNHVQAWLDSKTSTCNQLTLKRYYSALKKLELITNHKFEKFSIDWGVDAASISNCKQKIGFVKDKVMSNEIANSVLGEMRKGESLTWRSVELSRSVGLRVEETTGIMVRDIIFDNSGDGFGTVEIRLGCGSKGNRPRTIPIPTEEARNRLYEVVGNMKPDSLIVYNYITGDKLSTAAVSKAFQRALQKLGLYEEYKGNLNHSLRKLFAVEYFGRYRLTHSRKETVGRVNVILGHGAQRSEYELSKYVAVIY